MAGSTPKTSIDLLDKRQSGGYRRLMVSTFGRFVGNSTMCLPIPCVRRIARDSDRKEGALNIRSDELTDRTQNWVEDWQLSEKLRVIFERFPEKLQWVRYRDT